ncbi:MAG: DUF167 domain-containing protein [Verrucomicrobiota bacterium]
MTTRLAVRVQPGAKANEIVGWMTDAPGGPLLKIRLRAPAVEGKANAALLEFLAERLGLRPRQLALERGDKSRAKIVLVEGLTLEEIRQRAGA